MTEALAPLFEGKEVRVIEQDGEPWFPLPDLANAWGIDRNTPYNLIVRNGVIFEGMYQDCYVTYPPSDESAKVVCVNERGLYLMLGRINADRLKNPEAKAAIIRFQRWVPELIQAYRKKEIAPAPVAPIESELQQAKRIAELTGADLKAMQAAALKKCGLHEYAEALNVPALLHGESGGVWLNATQIGNRCSHSAQEINNFLSFHRFQYRDCNGIWRLTDKGEPHGEEYWYESAQKHREIRIRWRESILSASGLVRPESERLPERCAA